MGCSGSKPTAVSPTTGGGEANATGAGAEGGSSPKLKRDLSISKGEIAEIGPSTPAHVKPLETRYVMGKMLGKGGFGEVRQAVRKSDGKT